MAGPQLLHAVMAQLMLLLLWQLSPGESLSHNPHHDIILKHNHARYCQYSHRVALCQRGAVLILSLCFLESFSFAVWWNAKPPLSESACGEAEVSSLSIKILAFWRMLYHMYQSLELLSVVSFKSIICLMPILKWYQASFYEWSSYQNKQATKKSGAWITEDQTANIQLL